MMDIYDKLYPDKNSRIYKFNDPEPDFVVINLGQNDYGFPQSTGNPFPSGFSEKYISFIGKLRKKYKKSEIICAAGGMSGWKDSMDYKAQFAGVVDHLKAKDKKMHSFEFKAFSYCHPRTDIHEKMAGELTEYLRNEFGL